MNADFVVLKSLSWTYPFLIVADCNGVRLVESGGTLDVMQRRMAELLGENRNPVVYERHAVSDGNLFYQASFGNLVRCANWAEVIRLASNGSRLWYQAPLNYRPVAVACETRGKNPKCVRILVPRSEGDSFWADVSHISRFYRRVGA